MNFPRKKLSVAMAAVLTIAVVASAPAFAASVDAQNNVIVRDDAGDALIFPFYTTATGMNMLAGTDTDGNPVLVDATTDARSSFSVTNTSPHRSVVVKIRFREQFTSQEVFDFLVFLSPSDKFDFRIRQNFDPASGAPTEFPRVIWDKKIVAGQLVPGQSETSCIAPTNLHNVTNFNAPGGNNVFRAPLHPIPQVEKGLVTMAEALAVGHVEVIAMADITEAFIPSGVAGVQPGPLAAKIKHDPATGLPPDCPGAAQAFANLANVRKIKDLLDAPNSLIGRMLVSVPKIGLEAGTNAIPIKNTFLEEQPSAQTNAICDGQPGCQPLYAWDTKAASHPHFGSSLFIANVERQLQARALQNDWSRTENTGVGVDWVVSFPTKYVYLDTCDVFKDWKWCYTNTAVNPFPWDGKGDGKNKVELGCLRTNLDVWDIDEYYDGNVSPTPNPNLCGEVNVLTIHEKDTLPPSSFIQADHIRQAFQFDDNLFDGDDERLRGWAQIQFLWGLPPTRPANWTIQTALECVGETTKSCDPLYGAAVAGLAFTVRATTDPKINTASFTDLSRSDLAEDAD